MKDGLKLRFLRHQAGQDQHHVAARLNMTVANYSQIECSSNKLDGRLQTEALRIYGLTTDQFAQYSPKITD